MKLVIKEYRRFFKQKFQIWIFWGNNKSTRLDERYYNFGDAVDTCNAIKEQAPNAVIEYDLREPRNK